MIHPNEFNPSDPVAGGKGYLFDGDLQRAVKVALATERPLLLRGWPGTGKSRLARALATELDAPFYSEVVTSTTEARDVEWHFDAIQRLCDAQAGPGMAARVSDLGNYVSPRALWWAFDPQSALASSSRAPLPRPPARADRALVLIDEIDKAEPQVTNDLLEPFDGRGFTITETNQAVEKHRDVVLVVTTNEERDLPQAFVRRCVVYRLPLPKKEVLMAIGRVHFGPQEAPDHILERLATQTVAFQDEAENRRLRPPATAEFLDAVKAGCHWPESRLESHWDEVARLTLWKHDDE